MSVSVFSQQEYYNNGIIASMFKQKQDFSFLKETAEFIVELDYSNAKFDNVFAEHYFAVENLKDTTWESNYKKEMFYKFIKGISINSYLPLGYKFKENSLNADYKIFIKIIRLDRGKNTKTEISIIDINSSETLAQFYAYGSAGAFGSFTNLSGDAMVDLGENVAKFIFQKPKTKK